MMNKTKTSRAGLLKYALLIPVTGLLVISSNVQVLAKVIKEAPSYTEPAEAVVIESNDAATPIREVVVKEGKDVKTAMQEAKEWKAQGRVLDAQGEPLVGAIVLVKGTTIGTATDKSGNFSLKFKNAGMPTLVVSYVGRKSVEFVLKNPQQDIRIQLGKAPVVMEDIMVVGYTKKQEKPLDEFQPVEVMPEFPGGKTELNHFILKNMRYPAGAQDKGIQGKVLVSFTIDKDGKVTLPKVVQSICPELDKEALRVVKLMPDWKPATQSGKPVAVEYVLPFDFKMLEGEVVSVRNGSVVKENNAQIPLTKDVLIVLDGQIMPEGFELNSIPVDGIQSISVLKDGEATKIYGKGGEKGVIVITTKKK